MREYFASEVSTADYRQRVENFYSTLDAKEYSAVLYYSDGGHKRVNYASSATGQALAEDIESALQRATLNTKTLYRASNDFPMEKLKKGNILTFPAFVSTSYNPQITFKFLNKHNPVIFVITTNHGAEISMVHDEMEVLLPKGLTFEIKDTTTCDFYAAYPDTDYHVCKENITVVYLEEK